MPSRSMVTAGAQKPNYAVKLRCRHCSKIKPSAQFSVKERAKAAEKPDIDPTSVGIALCDACSCASRTNTELECQGCDKWMGLHRFSNTMRRNPDDALCWDCSTARQNVTPAVRYEDEDDAEDESGLRPPGESSDDESSDDEEDGGTTLGAYSNTSTLASLRLTESSGGVPLSASSGGGVSLGSDQRSRSTHASSSSSSTRTIIGRPRTITASTASVASTRASARTPARWAKIDPGVRGLPPRRPQPPPGPARTDVDDGPVVEDSDDDDDA